jgi:hypothetical protein
MERPPLSPGAAQSSNDLCNQAEGEHQSEDLFSTVLGGGAFVVLDQAQVLE